ncbi:hypothetical protein F4775DRAFT_574237 [Biscogniauxia sp. FL1348]|nr:hypothetical protein F4775DRAFT_574237 [Biscogniauxia sp. FL1348]
MPVRKSLLPREGLTADPIFKLIGRTALNPVFLLLLLILAKYTKKGEDMRIMHATAFSRIKALFYLGLARWLSNYLSDGVANNWSRDTYDWPSEIAVVTGGAGGIGGHVVKLLAERGVKVVVLDIQPMTFEAGPNIHYFRCDLTSPTSLADVAQEVRAKVGEPTILVNNAGVVRGKTILETNEQDLKFTFNVNTFAQFYTVKEFLPYMINKNHGMVVTVASYASWLPVPNMVDYAASKSATLAFHEGLTAELRTRYSAPKVRTIVVNPGYTKTPLFAGYKETWPFLAPALEPESVADAICEQIFSGRSGQVVAPKFGHALRLTQALPHWLTHSMRAHGENLMSDFHGRQVLKRLEKQGEGEGEVRNHGAEESTVLVTPGSG